jgi:NAD(P)-dependent dehydrogenase (short-subunit alcohol dehydrogenase family)
MVETGGGSIICTSSIAGMVGELQFVCYGTAKAAINQLVRMVSTQWGKAGIRCNAIAPGLILSPPSLGIGEDMLSRYESHSDTPYLGEPIDSARVVAFLASDASRFVTGQVLPVDGGLISHNPMVADLRVDDPRLAQFVPSGSPAQ